MKVISNLCSKVGELQKIQSDTVYTNGNAYAYAYI